MNEWTRVESKSHKTRAEGTRKLLSFQPKYTGFNFINVLLPQVWPETSDVRVRGR